MTTDFDDVSLYDYALPPELIASRPAARRDDARLLVVDRNTQSLTHHTIRDLPGLLSPGDRLVLNDTRVIPARLRGTRASTGGKWEGLFLRTVDDAWELLSQTRGRLRPGETILVPSRSSDAPPLRLVLIARGDDGAWLAKPASGDLRTEDVSDRSSSVITRRSQTAFDLLEQYGDVPLPPYIRKGVAKHEDFERYQTVFARTQGSVAAPTAGLHFTDELLLDCERRGLGRTFVTLHVGVGTFRPVATGHLSEHVMHSEWGELPPESARELCETRAAGRRIVAVGTTSVRVLESAAATGRIAPFRGETDLFIRPPYRFRAVDALLTNFHLPRSTLLVLVSTFAGHDLIRRAYEEAIRQRYRFYSYGDAMLVVGGR